MQSSTRIFRQTCSECERPALTLDDAGDPRCASHAGRFNGDTRVEPSVADRWAEGLVADGFA